LAIAEKGLVVLGCVAQRPDQPHAAREEGENALYKALDDVNACANFGLTAIRSCWGQ
jgi:acetylornithine deacetylase